jgi:hypothetical protein
LAKNIAEAAHIQRPPLYKDRALGQLGVDETPWALIYYNRVPGPKRDREVGALRAWMAKENVRELASATWPHDSATKSSTVAIVIEARGETGKMLEKRLQLTIDRDGLLSIGSA